MAVDAMVVLDVIVSFVARLAALGRRLVRFGPAARQRHDRSRSYRRSTHHEEATPVHACRRLRLALVVERLTVGWLAHCDLLQVIFSKSIFWCLRRHQDSVKASASSSIKTRPTRPTAR